MKCLNSIKWGFNALEIIFGAFVIVSVFFLSKEIEREYFPVVEKFNVLDIVESGEGFEISGNLDKVRQCEFRGIVAYVDDNNNDIMRPISVEFRENYNPNMAPIKQTWGPWYVYIPYKYVDVNVEFYVHHRCHSFYMTSSKIASFTVKHENGEYSLLQQ